MRRHIDFTKGSIIANLIMFSIPIILGELLQTLYNSVDALVVGNFVSAYALAAVNVCTIISSILVNFFNGMSFGANVIVSRIFGEKNIPKMHDAIKATFSFAVVLGVILSIAGILLTPQLLQLAGVHEEYYSEALTYLRIYLFGLMFTVIYNNGAGILRAIGDSSSPFIILVITCVLNIVLDLVFVMALGLEIFGVALATIISQALSAVMVYLMINKSCSINALSFKYVKSGRKYVADAMKVGMATGVQNALTSFSNLFVIRYMNYFSTGVVAGIGVAQKLDKFVGLPSRSLGITITTYISQNLGAGNYERVREGKNKVLLLAIGIALAFSIPLLISTDFWVGLFSGDPEVIAAGSGFLRTILPLLAFPAIREVYTGVLRGYQVTFVPMVLNLCGMVAVRQIYLAVRSAQGLVVEDIYRCYPIAWIAAVTFIVIYYCFKKKDLKGLSG